MKKMPLVLISFLLLIVLIMGITASSKHPSDKHDHHDIFSEYSFNTVTGASDGGSSIPSGKPDLIRDEETFLRDNVKKSGEMAQRLEDMVQRLKEGNDVEELEEMVEDYALLVSEADDYLSMAANSSSSSEEQEYLELSREKIILANEELNDIFRETRSYFPEALTLSRNENMNASGAGIVILSGDLDIGLNISEGKLTVVDFAGDLEINTEEFHATEVKIEQPMIPVSNTGHQMLSYKDAQGNVTLSGSVLTVAIMSNDMILDASGTGEVELYGDGIYMLSDSGMESEGIWIPPIFEIR